MEHRKNGNIENLKYRDIEKKSGKIEFNIENGDVKKLYLTCSHVVRNLKVTKPEIISHAVKLLGT